MQERILLNDRESRLRDLLLDASKYMGLQHDLGPPQLRFTGGWVRDKLLGLESNDIDVGIDNMTGMQFGNHLQSYLSTDDARQKHQVDKIGTLAKIEANPEKSKHLETVKTKVCGLEIDLVNLRKETYTEDSRNPQMEFGTPEEDALRRDATVNALFYNLSTNAVEDFTNRGLEDMKAKVIKTPLAPFQTFKDDPLRVLRCIRFASRLGFTIADEDKTAMKNSAIKVALRSKISRERVGVEIIKMMHGPNQVNALSLIDQLDLYNDVFTDPSCTDPIVDTSRWTQAYSTLWTIAQTSANNENDLSRLRTLKNLLLQGPQDEFVAWLLSCFVPWARLERPQASNKGGKALPSLACVAAREGLKADNKFSKVLDDAVRFLPDIVKMRISAYNEYFNSSTEGAKSGSPIGREVHGQFIRSMGASWRSMVLYAILVEVSDVDGPSGKQLQTEDKAREADEQEEASEIMRQYTVWLAQLHTLELLDAPSIIPLIKGTHLQQALGIKSGKWMQKALELAMDWQLRNPSATDPNPGIEEVISRKAEYLKT